MRYDIITRDYHPDPKGIGLFSFYGRNFQNISELLSTLSAKDYVEKIGMVNSFLKDIIIKYADQYQYKRIYKFQKIYLNAKSFACLYWWGNLKALINPYKYSNQILENYKNDFQKLLNRVKNLCDDAINEKYSFKDLTETIFYDYGSFFTYDELTLLLSIGKGFQKIIDLFSPYFDLNPNMKIKVFDISKCYVNSTNIIGIELFKLSKLFDNEIYNKKSFEEFLFEYKQKKFAKQFYIDFQNFIEKYGCRCEGEIDIKNLRYYEDPEKVVKLIYDLIINFDKSVKTPMEIFEEAEKRRPKLYEELLNFSKEKNFDKEFEEAYHYLNLFYKEKETSKYYFCQILEVIKNYLNKIYQEKLEKSGLFENKNEIYDLTVYQLSDIIEKPNNFDREEILNIIKENKIKSNIVGNWKNRSMVFDSKGRMFYPEKNANLSDNEIAGESVSSGIIKGKAVVMNKPNDKKINKDEILVAKATDPSWVVTIMK